MENIANNSIGYITEGSNPLDIIQPESPAKPVTKPVRNAYTPDWKVQEVIEKPVTPVSIGTPIFG